MKSLRGEIYISFKKSQPQCLERLIIVAPVPAGKVASRENGGKESLGVEVHIIVAVAKINRRSILLCHLRLYPMPQHSLPILIGRIIARIPLSEATLPFNFVNYFIISKKRGDKVNAVNILGMFADIKKCAKPAH
jgi:hypothetical protein